MNEGIDESTVNPVSVLSALRDTAVFYDNELHIEKLQIASAGDLFHECQSDWVFSESQLSSKVGWEWVWGSHEPACNECTLFLRSLILSCLKHPPKGTIPLKKQAEKHWTRRKDKE